MCCGNSRSRAAQGPLANNIEYIEAVYNSPNEGEETVYSSTKIDQKTRRRLMISPAATRGDVLFVPISDVLAKPQIFVSTCGEPFIRQGASLIDPCASIILPPAPPPDAPPPGDYGVGLEAVSWEDTERELYAVFGPLAARKIVKEFGHVSARTIFATDAADLVERLGNRVAEIVERRRNAKNN